MHQSVPDDVARIVACSIVDSRLYYCNSQFVGMTDRNFKKLQRVQNTLARVVLCAGKFEHITPALIQLHWLPVKQRALYKLALITFNVLQHNNPMYLRDLLTTHSPSRNALFFSTPAVCRLHANCFIVALFQTLCCYKLERSAV